MTSKVEEELRQMTSVYASALPLYREAGWDAILPVPPAAKMPPPSGFTGGTARLPSDAEYAVWSTSHAAWNVALRLPDGVLGIDVDEYGSKHGATNLEDWAIDRELPALPPTWSSSSRDGESRISFFRVPSAHNYV